MMCQKDITRHQHDQFNDINTMKKVMFTYSLRIYFYFFNRINIKISKQLKLHRPQN